MNVIFNNAVMIDRNICIYNTMLPYYNIDVDGCAGHNYGPLAEETMEVLAMVDVYTGLLLKEWTGKVIVVADHGMHFADPEGDHGNFQLEDMFVPYIIN
mgnify:CR=1 FL=1